MTDHWVNIYGINNWESIERSNFSAWNMTDDDIRRCLDDRAKYENVKILYRIHVKLKPPKYENILSDYR